MKNQTFSNKLRKSIYHGIIDVLNKVRKMALHFGKIFDGLGKVINRYSDQFVTVRFSLATSSKYLLHILMEERMGKNRNAVIVRQKESFNIIR